MGRAKRKSRLADYDFKMAENNLCKTKGKEKESFRVFLSEGNVHQLVQKDKIPCPQSSCEKVFSKEMAFSSTFVCGKQMYLSVYLHGRKLAGELGSQKKALSQRNH